MNFINNAIGVKAVKMVFLVNTPVMNYVNGNLILRYLSQQCNKTERDEINKWLDESSQNQNTFNYLKLVVNQLN